MFLGWIVERHCRRWMVLAGSGWFLLKTGHPLRLNLQCSREHDMKRKVAKRSEMEALKQLIKNGKYFLHPEKNCGDFKELFQRLASIGAGRPADRDGFAEGPWTPDLLAAAVTEIDPSGAGIELRTVQLWFQDNEKGISSDNIRWLARIFGCNDPEATSEWQAELIAARSRLVAKRRAKRHADGNAAPEAADLAQLDPGNGTPDALQSLARGDNAKGRKRRFSLARASESVFGGSPLNLPSSVFAGAVALGFASYFLGIHEVSFDAPDGHSKQVGFLWAPNWTILFMAFMPLFFGFVAELLFFWKDEGRVSLLAHDNRTDSAQAWARNLQASSYTFWAVLLICVLFAGFFQWVGVRLLPLIKGGGDYATDWGSLAVMRPEVISVPETIAFTGFAYLYMCICFYLFFAAFIFLYSVTQDFGKILTGSGHEQSADRQQEFDAIGTRMICGVFRCTILAVFIAICMKLQSAYLLSSGANIASWLIGDMGSIFGAGEEIRFADYSAPNHFSSFLIVLVAVFVFLDGAFRLGKGNRFHVSLRTMIATVGLLVASYLLIGTFAGFSILLSVAVLLAAYGLIDPGLAIWKARELEDEQVVS